MILRVSRIKKKSSKISKLNFGLVTTLPVSLHFTDKMLIEKRTLRYCVEKKVLVISLDD